ncbi:voltage-gated potassium channel protein [Acidiferrobacter sp.]|uniref:voltage-gated potassium channel protein n=1 Tax=Acidiferrobacter sp. TaxID=1872107 RepID=UPI0026248BF4|nr:voltage-gated potassium channel protein [Acidiferrobacter sp.]
MKGGGVGQRSAPKRPKGSQGPEGGTPAEALRLAPWARWRQGWEQGRQRFRGWFPHVPVALAVVILGLINLAPVWHVIKTEISATPFTIHALTTEAWRIAPRVVAGFLLFGAAGGLLWRSRLSWTVALLLAAATLMLAWRSGAATPEALMIFNGLILLVLLVFQRDFDRSSLAAGTLFAIVSILLLLGYAVFGTFVLGRGFAPPVTTLTSALYFAVVTMATVGYGDIVPKSADARFFVMSVIILGITVFATSISAVVVPAMTARMQNLMKGGGRRMIRKNHYVIVGATSLARNTCRELLARHLPVTVIVSSAADTEAFGEADVLVGDASDADVLRKAGVPDATAVLALRDDDSENAFTVLAVKELNPATRTVAAVNHGKNMARVHHVRPDLVIAPQVMGGELLAMALNNEELDSETLMRRLFQAGKTDQ